MLAHLSRYPEDYLCYVDEEVVVRFAYPSPMIDWAGFAFITHVPSVSSVTLRWPYAIILADGTIEREPGELLHGEELLIQKRYQSERAREKLEAILTDEDLMQRIFDSPQECQEAIQGRPS